MDIVIGQVPFVKKDPEKKTEPEKGRRRDRRKNRQDRRKTVRDGVIVSLSIPNDRRTQPERRRG